MPRPNQVHHKGTYPKRAALVVAGAYANPNTRCWRDGRTLAEHPPHRTGKPPIWTAGHVIDGDPRSPLLPEVSTCNYREGARLGGLIRQRQLRQQRRGRRSPNA